MNLPDPAVHVSGATEVADGVLVIPNEHVSLVPNIGVISGTEAILVVDTGLGLANASQVRDFAEEVARGRRIHLTTTHFHPEHAFGASVFESSYLVNRAQDGTYDWREKGPVASLSSDFSGIQVDVFTDQEAFQIYSCGGQDGMISCG